jgi:pectate lyase
VAVALLVAAAVVVTGAAAHAATLFSDDFEDGNANGWSKSGGTWSVVPDGSLVYRQSGTGSDAKAQAGDAGWDDQTVQARVRPTGFNGAGRFAGVLARAQTMTRYYYLALSNEGELVLGRRISGTHTTLAAAPAPVTIGTWYTLRLEASGGTLRGFLNGTLAISASDGELATGRAGLVTLFASASFDDVVVTDTAGPGPSPTTGSPSPSEPPTSSPTASPSPTDPPPPPPPGQADGFAGMDTLGQDGTTGGAGGPAVQVDTGSELLTAIAQPGPLVIEVAGVIALPGPMHDVSSDKTIVGLGAGAGITGGGLNVGLSIDDDITSPPPNAVHNVIIRNLTFDNWADDAINVQMFSHHVWVDHNTFVDGGDGGVDVKRGSSFVTVSWNHIFHDKNMLLGHDDDNGAQDVGRLNVTYHHNWFDGSGSRNPRVRFGDPVHVFNNYYLNNEDYGIASTMDAGVLVEGNFFEGVDDPYHLGEGSSGPGSIVARDNCFVDSGAGQAGGSVAPIPYSYALQACGTVPADVTAGAGVGRV